MTRCIEQQRFKTSMFCIRFRSAHVTKVSSLPVTFLYSICIVDVVDEIPEITEVDATCEVTEVDGFEDGEATKR